MYISLYPAICLNNDVKTEKFSIEFFYTKNSY